MENINEQKIARSKKKKKKTKSLLNLKPKRILKSQKLKENMEQFTNYVRRKCLILHQWKTNIFIQAWQANFGIRANVVTLPTLQSQGLKMKETILLFICK